MGGGSRVQVRALAAGGSPEDSGGRWSCLRWLSVPPDRTTPACRLGPLGPRDSKPQPARRPRHATPHVCPEPRSASEATCARSPALPLVGLAAQAPSGNQATRRGQACWVGVCVCVCKTRAAASVPPWPEVL